jgi:hypothetical protein
MTPSPIVFLGDANNTLLGLACQHRFKSLYEVTK